jgi:hypothetical protein
MDNEWMDDIDVLAYAIHHAKPDPYCRYTSADRAEAENIRDQLRKLGFAITEAGAPQAGGENAG